jgi:hypothetical protein
MISNLALPDCNSTPKYTISDSDVRILQNTHPLNSHAIQTRSGDHVFYLRLLGLRTSPAASRPSFTRRNLFRMAVG